MLKHLSLLFILCLTACSSGVVDNIDKRMVFFEFDSAKISDEAKSELEAQSLYMKKNPDIKVLMAGHCDERGTTEYNLALGAVRAGNAAHVLIRDGIEPRRINTISYGKNRPQFHGTGPAVWAKNRNVTTIVK